MSIFPNSNYVITCITGLLATWQTTSGQLKEDAVFCTPSDYNMMAKFDSHVHIESPGAYFIEQAVADNFRFLAIINDRPFGVPMADQRRFTKQNKREFPQRMEFATAFRVANWNDNDWVATTISTLNAEISDGLKAVKIWKNIGLDLRDQNGEFVMVDHPRIDSILAFLAEKNIAVIGHNGEPKDCWLPLDQMTFSSGYYREHPQYHMYNFPEYPSYEKQIEARDNMLAKHPNLRFLGAHMGSLEW